MHTATRALPKITLCQRNIEPITSHQVASTLLGLSRTIHIRSITVTKACIVTCGEGVYSNDPTPTHFLYVRGINISVWHCLLAFHTAPKSWQNSTGYRLETHEDCVNWFLDMLRGPYLMEHLGRLYLTGC
jgi:hypothetical protein